MSQPLYELVEGDFEGFFAVPRCAYPGDSLFVSPMKADLKRFLDSRKNPLLSAFGEGTYFVVRRNGVPTGRIVAHIHRQSNQMHRLQRAYFGYFDCADDRRTASMLFRAAETYARTKGLTELAGNFNLTAMQQIGVVTDGFAHVPYTDQLYNPPHIPQLLAANGYESFFPMSTWEVNVERAMEAIGGKRQSEPEGNRTPWTIHNVTRRGLSRSMEAARVILNDGFRDNPLFVPVSAAEYAFQAKDLALILDPRISKIAYIDSRPVGVVVCIPDLNPFLRATKSVVNVLTPASYLWHRFRRNRAVIIYYAVCRDVRGRGLMQDLLGNALRSLQAAGYETVGVTWIADTNLASLRQIERLGARRMHETKLFRKLL